MWVLKKNGEKETCKFAGPIHSILFIWSLIPGMVGSGRASVAEICDMSRANVEDGLRSKTVYGLKSLGGSGKHEQNQERDLHRWVKGLHGMTLEPYGVTMDLNVAWIIVDTISMM